MSERTLTVRLRAVATEYTKALHEAGRVTEELATKADKVSAWGDKATDVGGKLTRNLTLPIAGIGAAALMVAGQYEASMREVQALTGATATEMELLSGQAKKMGAETQFSATQAADAMAQLIKGGFDVRQTYEALPGVMQLAAAASLDIASAADIATNVLSGFGLGVEELARVNDYLSQTANMSDTDVRELGEAFKYVGPVAKGAGLSLEETTAIMGLLAENGIRASMAGTALRGMITALLAPTNKTTEILSELGVTATTSTGQMRPMADIIDQLAASGATTADIMAIFGQRAGPAMVALLGQGSEALTKFSGTLEDSRGVAQNLADAKMGGLTGAIEELKGSLETLAITIGESGLLGLATGMADAATGFVNSVGELPSGVRNIGLVIAGVAAASGPAIWGLGKMAELYKPVTNGLSSLTGSLENVRYQWTLARMAGMNAGQAWLALFGPGAAVVVGLAALAGAVYLARREAERFESSHQGAADAAGALAESAGIALHELQSIEEGADSAVVSMDDFRRANEDAIATLRNLKGEADQQAYLVEVGYQLVLRGASAEDAFDQVRQLAEAAGVELPVDLTIANIGEFEGQVEAVLTRVRRVVDEIEGLGEDVQLSTLPREMKSDLDAVARAAADAWKTDNVAGFVQILAAAEAGLGDNAVAINYLTDQALKYSEVQGLSTRKTADSRDALDELTGGASVATFAQQDLIDRIRRTASEMDGGLTPANLAAAAAMETAGANAGTYGDKVRAAEDATGGAAEGVQGLTDELGDQEQAAQDAEDALRDYLDTLRGSVDPLFQMVSSFRANKKAQWDLLVAQREYMTAVAEHGPDSLQAADAASKIEDAQSRVGESALDAAEAAFELQSKIEDGSVSLDTANRLLMTWTDQGLIGADTARQLAEQFGLAAIHAAVAGQKIDDLGESAAAVDGATVTIDVKMSGAAMMENLLDWVGGGEKPVALPKGVRPAGSRAAGGPVTAGLAYLVGEQGPEIFHAPASGSIIPANDTARYLAGQQIRPGAVAAFGDSRIVDRLDALERSMSAMLPGVQVSYHQVRTAPAAEDIVRAQRSARFLAAR